MIAADYAKVNGWATGPFLVIYARASGLDWAGVPSEEQVLTAQ